MDISAALKAGRQAAAATFTDTVKIERSTGNQVTDPITGVVTDEVVTVYEGPGKIQITGAAVTETASAGHQFTMESMNLHLPVGTDPIQVDDSGKITGSKYNASRIGQQFRISGLMEKTHATAQRLKVVRLTG